MLYDQLAARETNAHAYYAGGLGGFVVDDFGHKPNIPWGEGYYYEEDTLKRAIVLHYTMGALEGDIPTLTNSSAPPQGHVSVSFVAARSGRVYRLFEPDYWSYHLGPGTVGGNQRCSSSTIGIELTNRGPLKLSPGGDALIDAYGQNYCRPDQHEAYTRLAAPFRGFSYFASFTAPQLQAVATLLRRLADKFDIPLTMLPVPSRFQTFDTPTALAYRGVCSHVNFRLTGKSDIGPAFNWDDLGLAVEI